MALDFPVGTDFPANGNQIPDGEIYEGFYWDASTGAWKRVCDRDKIGDCLDDDNNETVCDKLEALRQDVIELEEEIDAIAPSVEYGTWKWEQPAAAGDIPAAGTFYLQKDATTLTDQYAETLIVAIHNDEYVAPGDTDPVDTHTWADADIGELIQLFDAADPDFMLGKITAKTVDSPNSCVFITVDLIQSSGVPDDNPDPVTGEYLTRINVFKEPSGGNASDFVLKAGDEMSGDLTMVKDPFPGGSGSPKIVFKSNNDAGTSTYTNSLYMLKNDRYLQVGGELRAGSYLGANGNLRYNSSTRVGMSSDSNSQYLGVGTSNSTTALYWDKANGVTGIRAHDSWGNNGQVLKKFVNSSTSYVYWGNAGNVDISCNSSNRSKGDMWYCSNDGTLYIKVS